jgi:hypothetical protein
MYQGGHAPGGRTGDDPLAWRLAGKHLRQLSAHPLSAREGSMNHVGEGIHRRQGGPDARTRRKNTRTARVGGRKQRNTAMRMQPRLVTGIAAAVLALTASAAAAHSPGRTPGGGAVLVSARHAPADTRFTELRALDQVKRAVAWAEVERAWARQPHADTRFTDQRHLAQVKRQAAWRAADRAAKG